jgi:hypothetical protein
MSKPSTRPQKQPDALQDAVKAYTKARDRLARVAVDWFDARGYASGPVPPADQRLANAIRHFVETRKVADRILAETPYVTRTRTARR